MLTDEKARHPFLASLPPHVRRDEEPRPIKRSRPAWFSDVRDFLIAYCACFLVVSVYIA